VGEREGGKEGGRERKKNEDLNKTFTETKTKMWNSVDSQTSVCILALVLITCLILNKNIYMRLTESGSSGREPA
jgi:hypothetical protein